LYKHVLKAAKRNVKQHKSPLHILLHTYNLDPTTTEKIRPVIDGPKWSPLHSTVISESKENALQEALTSAVTFKAYSDGSAVDGFVGAAAVLFKNGQEIALARKRLGRVEEHTVYEGEIVGAILAVNLLRDHAHSEGTLVLLDNQAAIRASGSEKPHPGQHLIKMLHKEISYQGGRGLTLQWIAGHKGNLGNERSDEEAKKAARGDETNRRAFPRSLRGALPASISAVKQVQMANIKKLAKQVWTKSPRYTRASAIDPALPSPAFLRLSKNLSKRNTSILMQLRTGHAQLSKHLFRLCKVESPLCPACRAANETVHHYLHRCPAYLEHRKFLRASLGRGAESTKFLLTNKAALQHLFIYINGTARFKQSHGELQVPEESQGKDGRERGQGRVVVRG
jgi:ribonuclease HI